MNAIKYRALAKDGTWRYGSYPCLNVDMGNTIYPMDIFWNSFLSTFRRETLGQWTGLLDKQGKEIYEGDIVRITLAGFGIEKDLVVKWENGAYKEPMFEDYHREIISNIHENPELIP